MSDTEQPEGTEIQVISILGEGGQAMITLEAEGNRIMTMTPTDALELALEMTVKAARLEGISQTVQVLATATGVDPEVLTAEFVARTD